MPPKPKLPISRLGEPRKDKNVGTYRDVDIPSDSDERHATTLCPSDLDTIRQSQLGGGRKGRMPIGQNMRDLDPSTLHPHVLHRKVDKSEDNDQQADRRSNVEDNNNWHSEELKLLTEFEKFSTAKSDIHLSVHHRFSKKNKWLRFILNVAVTIAGTSGIAAVIASFNFGVVMTTICTLILGIASTTGDSFEWHKKANDHSLASDRYMRLSMEIRRLKVGHNLGRDYCTVSLLRISERYAEIHNSAPWTQNPNV